MPLDEKNKILTLSDLLKNIEIPSNMYISDENKAVELVSLLIRNEKNTGVSFQNKIKNQINKLFSLFSDVTIENEIILYKRFMDLCSRLSERRKIQKIQDKVVISFGGKVSAGKSRFINTISGIGDKLPVDQKTTTAIPTYIIKSNEDLIHANSVYGYSTKISSEALNAMAHEFNDVYGIGFPSFVDSIIIESPEYKLSREIALLDTPGYTKFDAESDSKMVIADRQKAYNQLSVSDYLIWLIDIDSGAITQDDIEFIESLGIATPILIVFTKADLKTESDIKDIIKVAKSTISKTTINCFGITAYSAKLEKEYGNNQIKKFLNYALKSEVRNSDILTEFYKVETEMRELINKAIEASRNNTRNLFSYILESNQIMEIRSLATLWGKENQNSYKLNKLLNNFDNIISEINKDMHKYFNEGGAI